MPFSAADFPTNVGRALEDFPGPDDVAVEAAVDLTRIISDQYLVTMLLMEAHAIAGLAIDMFIRPSTPMLSGALRNSLRSSVHLDGNDIVITFIAGGPTASYAKYLEMPWYAGRIHHYTTPGTRAPFLQPGAVDAIPFIMGRIVDLINDVG